MGGKHGTVSWLHSLLYMPTSDPSTHIARLCEKFVPNAWHPVLLVGESFGCGFDDGADMRELSIAKDAATRIRARTCWQQACPRIVSAYQGCANATSPSTQSCPIEFGMPLLMVRHPLKVISSFVAGYCDSDPVRTSARFLFHSRPCRRLVPYHLASPGFRMPADRTSRNSGQRHFSFRTRP